MSNYRQQQLIAELETQVEHLLTKSIGEWQLVQHSQFALKPSADGWSANECLQHLNSYGRYYLPAIQKAIDKAASGSTENFYSGWLGNYFTKMMMPKENGSLATKMKSPKDHAPTKILESHQVIAEFIEQQEMLLKLLHSAKCFDLNKVKVGISLAPFIKLKLGDVFMFLIVHLIRHGQQADRALSQSGIATKRWPSVSFPLL
ncbi:MAG: DinB family protein [Cyclobacteriaceae bacterium]|nr:DinB family protein [Cyclobacteriaceae bacterium]